MRSWIVGALLTLAMAGGASNENSAALIQAKAQLRQVSALQWRYREELHDSDLSILAGKVDVTETYRRGQPACLADSGSIPTVEERAALRRWADLRRSYLDRVLEITSAPLPVSDQRIVPLMAEYNEVLRDGARVGGVLIAALADGQMSYCQFAARDRDLTEAVLREGAALRTEIDPHPQRGPILRFSSNP